MQTNLNDWSYLYNWDGTQWHRANLVYTPYISPDKNTLCMSFNRDELYHTDQEENAQWTEDMLTTRFNREISYHSIAKSFYIPTLQIKDVDIPKRHIFLEWHGADFHTQGFDVLPDWKEQWLLRLKEMWTIGIFKYSLHPNSWVAHDGVLIPFNWFFSFSRTEPKITIRDFLIQISSDRQDKLKQILQAMNMNLDTPYDVVSLQALALNSFRSNYPEDLINQALKNHALLQQNI
jgi:hypothetical protein